MRTRSVSVFCGLPLTMPPHSGYWWQFADTNSTPWGFSSWSVEDLFPGLLEVVNLEIHQTIPIVDGHFHLDQSSNADETGDFGTV